MKTARFVVIALVSLLVSAPAVAQDAEPVENEEFGVTITPPDSWEVETDDDKAVANFKHPESQSQIQVIGTQLMNEEVSDVFFDTFHQTLTESNFEQVGEEEKTIGDFEGTATDYEFEHSGVTLEVTVFEFLRDDTAWLAIGYMQDEEREARQEDYTSVVENMTFEDEDDNEEG